VAGVPYDPDAARLLLAEAGAEGLRVELMALPGSADRDLAAVLQESWRAVGVEATVVPVERAVFLERLAKGDFAAALHRFTGGNQFTTIFKGAFHSRSIHDGRRGELNFARLSDARLDRMIDEADLTGDRAARARLYGEVQRRVADLAPWLLLWHPDTVAVAGPRVAGFEVDRGGDFTFMRSLGLRAR
jgi:ABC-type transport system substrate-binding protein